MNDPRLKRLLEALSRFAERLSWLRPFQGAEEPESVENVRAILDEWALLEPQLELLEAVVGREQLAPVLVRVAKLRAQVRMAFLLVVWKLLYVTELHWTNEMLMRVPALLAKLPPAEAAPPEIADALRKLGGTFKEWPDPERMFRESMQAADNCEPVMKALHQQLLKEWPEEWTPAMQTRLERLDPPDIQAWREELRRAAAAL